MTTDGETSLSGKPPATARRPTMLDVAALAGVGLKTVSRVVNGEPGVSAALEGKVRRAIEQLNYRRDANASMLRRLGGKTQTIGLVLEDVANPFSSALHRSIEDEARSHNVLLFAGSCDEDPRRERELIGSFRDRRVDGIIVVPASHDHTYLYDEKRAGTALVFAGRPDIWTRTPSARTTSAERSRRSSIFSPMAIDGSRSSATSLRSRPPRNV